MGKKIVFESMKEFVFLENLGKGGTGEAVLLMDEQTGNKFAFKKYAPEQGNDTDDTYDNFKDEIEILFRLSHNNIVRIFNYYLYPDSKTGYIQMEYIDGLSIDNYLHGKDLRSKEKIFEQLIDVFEYMENNGVIHRDIRNSNILIDADGCVKVIDFGFSKIIEIEEEENSVHLNWPVTQTAEEVHNRIYNSKTEIYYVGWLFKKIIGNDDFKEFRYKKIIDRMTQSDPEKRIDSFLDINEEISSNTMNIDKLFTDEERRVFNEFSNVLLRTISEFKETPVFVNDYSKLISRLEDIYLRSSLFPVVKNPYEIIQAFTSSDFKYWRDTSIRTEVLKDFTEFLHDSSSDKLRIIMINIKNALREVDVQYDYSDDLPF